jgi:hypothetical protein
MPYRVLVVGPDWFRAYTLLRDILDNLLAQRMPDVEVITTGGKGIPSLVASYARMRKLEFRPVLLDCERYPLDPFTARNLELVNHADAAVVFLLEPCHEVHEIHELIKQRKLPCRLIDLSKPVRFPRNKEKWPDQRLPD